MAKEILKIFISSVAFVAALGVLFIGWVLTVISNTLGWDWQSAGAVLGCVGIAAYFIYRGVKLLKDGFRE